MSNEKRAGRDRGVSRDVCPLERKTFLQLEAPVAPLLLLLVLGAGVVSEEGEDA